MANLFISFVLLMFSIMSFDTTLRYGKANRTFFSLSPTIIETSVAIVESSSLGVQPYFDQIKLEENVVNFLSEELFPTFDTYEISFYYYEPLTEVICLSSQCSAVRIRLICFINPFWDYNRQLRFEIQANSL